MDGTRIFVVKIASRCNLNCSYCYMYHHPDQTWRAHPKFMSAKTVDELGRRLYDHVQSFDRGNVMVVLHGGEPLLFPDLFYILDRLKERVGRIEFAIQTNGTLFNEENLKVLKLFNVRIGISIDGNRDIHNRYRVDHQGNGSYDTVIEGLRLAQAITPESVDSVLQVIDTAVDPLQMLNILEAYGIDRGDLLFPDLNHDSISTSNLKPGDLGSWLIAVFDEWVLREKTIYIRIYLTIVKLLLGDKMGTDQLGANSAGALMIETDGTYDIHDGLKTSYEGAGHTHLNVSDTPIKQVEDLPFAIAFREKSTAACQECRECRLFAVCGGGSPFHRYSQEKQYNQPSVFCKDLILLIDHIRDYLKKAKPELELVC